MKKVKRFMILALGCIMLVGGTVTANAAVKAMPYTTECPSCHTDTGVKGAAYKCAFCSANGNVYKCARCYYGYFRCANGHCYA